MKKLTAKNLLLILLFFGAGITSAYSAQQSNEQSNVTLKAIPEITINGEKFLLKDVPHDQTEKLHVANVPVKLGEFSAPVNLKLKNATEGAEFVTWRVAECSADINSKYYLEPKEYKAAERTQDEKIVDPGKMYYESPDGSDFEANITLNASRCYRIFMEVRKGDQVGLEELVYFVIKNLKGEILPDFSMEFDHSDASIFDPAKNESVVLLAPEFITLKDISQITGEVNITEREWQIEWFDILQGKSSHGKAVLPISSADKKNETLKYNINNPGSYVITLKVKGNNGLSYSSKRQINEHASKTYFENVILQRDLEKKDFTEFLKKVENISDTDLKNLYKLALDECKMTEVKNGDTTGYGMGCSKTAEEAMKKYDENIKYLNVPCTTFPDLNKLSSSEELCRAANVVKQVEAFSGDGVNSATPGYLRPESLINRIEMCAVLNKSKISTARNVLPFETASSKYSDLKDLDNKDWRKTHAEACVQFAGYPDGTFRPESNINMVEALKVLFKVYNADVPDAEAQKLSTYCPDLPNNVWYSKFLAMAFGKGFMKEIKNSCDAGKNFTRGEIVLIMYRMFYEYAYKAMP